MAGEHAAPVGHQMETWDPELVPDARGRIHEPDATCPVEAALAAISGRWTTLVIRELMQGPRSFSDLRACLPALSAKVLTDRLRGLAERGLVTRDRTPGFPARTTYRLTSRGLRLRPLLMSLYQVGTALLDEPEAIDSARGGE